MRSFYSLAEVSRIESRVALRRHRPLGSCQTSKNVSLTRDDALAKLRCVSIAPAHNVVRQCSTSSGKFCFLEACEHVVCLHWHTAALFLKFFAAGCCDCSSAFCLSNIVVNGRNQHGNREKAHRNDLRGGTIGPLHHFLLQTFHHWTFSQKRLFVVACKARLKPNHRIAIGVFDRGQSKAASHSHVASLH